MLSGWREQSYCYWERKTNFCGTNYFVFQERFGAKTADREQCSAMNVKLFIVYDKPAIWQRKHKNHNNRGTVDKMWDDIVLAKITPGMMNLRANPQTSKKQQPKKVALGRKKTELLSQRAQPAPVKDR